MSETTNLPALPSIEYLSRNNVPFRVELFPEETEKGAANVAKALGFHERQMLKTLIFEVDTGEKILVMVGGDQNIKSGLLKKAVGSRNIRMASPDVVRQCTGYAIGSIPPFHWQPAGFRTFLEQTLLDEDLLGVGTGQWGVEIIIKPDDLVRASNSIVCSLVDNDS
ncbi:MAG TPA: YbaK/EbsC family protein [Candidatus Obscuribacterales bacterium]